MTLTPAFWDRARRVMDAPASDRFVALLRAAGLDPATDLRHGDLRGCDLSGEDLAGFDFSGADLTGANLDGADLTAALGLDRAEGLDQARFDDDTRWPREPWTDASGRDRFGRWASFTIVGKDGVAVTQRMRWCPPGRFAMGSPEDEEGRWDDEGPVQPIEFAQGFWMADTPCTQALWLAVMGGNNPCRFQTPDRPVESLSFKQVQAFLHRLNKLRPGLDLALPSEAQWEYGCRARTTEATYGGPMSILGTRNAPVLDDIAWYGGNSGVGFDLENGADANWSAKQYAFAKAGTRRVGLKKPNPWGLYDTLGNVFEWCADAWHNSHDWADPGGAPRAGDSTAGRVIRGGSWLDEARYARAAHRNESGPEYRGSIVGFRCVRGHSGLPVKSEPRPAGTVQRQRGDRASRQSPPGAASASL